jgi:hypothetical protein
MSLADPFTMPDYRARHARGANRDMSAPIHRRAVYEGPLPDPRVQPFDARTVRAGFIIRTIVQLICCAIPVAIMWALLS